MLVQKDMILKTEILVVKSRLCLRFKASMQYLYAT